MITIDDWHGCYRDSWKGAIVQDAFSHPAKFSRSLIGRIYEHATSEGWLHEGDIVLDPFAGVSLGAFDALHLGMNWIGIELEARFVDISQRNIDLWHTRYKNALPKWGWARIIEGDSRNLIQLMKKEGIGITGVISSPPYADRMEQVGGIDPQKSKFKGGPNSQMNNNDTRYGSTPGQLGAMPVGNFNAVISSPPWLETRGGTKPINGDEALAARHAAGNLNIGIGNDPRQLTNTSDYWSASRAIVTQIKNLLSPGGHVMWVVKDYVENGRRIPFCDRWRRLFEGLGFVALHEHHALVVEQRGVAITLEGEIIEKRVERKSFFRRVAEKHGSPRIDWETVLCFEKPAKG